MFYRVVTLLCFSLFIAPNCGMDPHLESVQRESNFMRECLPTNIMVEMANWMRFMKDVEHYRALEHVGLRELQSQLKSGRHICGALEDSVIKMMNTHRYRIKQWESASRSVDEAGGWALTTSHLREMSLQVQKRCKDRGWIIEDKKETLRCMNLFEKRSTQKLLVHYLP